MKKSKEKINKGEKGMESVGEILSKPMKKMGDFKRPSTVAKHKVVLKKFVENRGNMSKAIRDSGLYSNAYAKNPKQLFKSDSWAELMEEAFPDKDIAMIHRGLLTAHKIKPISFDPKISDEDAFDLCRQSGFTPTSSAFFDGKKWIFCIMPDTNAQDDALDKVYKIKGRYKETFALEGDRFRKMQDAELAEIIAKGQKFFSKQ